MGITHKKRLFAKHFARTKDRRGSIEAAAYSLSDWPRQASRLLADPEVLRLIELEQDKEVRRERAGNMALSDVIAELQEMYQAADEKPGRRGWSAKLKVLEVLGRLVSGKREEAQPTIADDPNAKLSTSELNQRIATLTAQLAPASEQQVIAGAPSAAYTSEHHPNAIDAPRNESEAKAANVVNNPALVPQSPDERLQECGRHGSYLSVRVRGSWSYCPACVKEWSDNERYLAGLMPAGDGRK